MHTSKNDIRKTALIAVGGNSLIVSKDKQAIPDQYEAAVQTVKRIVDMIEQNWNVVITHGSGPQVGFILRRSELARNEISQVPMDYADADIQGAVGYMFQRALHNEFTKRRIDRAPITVITQVLVDKKDPAFENPTKPIGPQLNEEIAKQRAAEHGWIVKEDAGRGWRRVVPSPKPKKIIELEQIRHLVDANYVVIACGGGGIPVIENEKNYLVGVEAVIDKDLASGMLASSLGVDLFIISTDVDKVAINFRKKNQQWLDCMTLSDARAFHAAGQFDEGSMGPKIQAMSQYLEHGGRRGLITNPEKLELALQGKSGTAFGG